VIDELAHVPVGAGRRARPLVVGYGVEARGEGGGGRPRLVTVYLDPPSARVLDVVNFRSSFFGFLHRFHENLTVPDYSGRAIVGWAGVGMLILSLTGLWLWWPRNGVFRAGLRWRRAGDASMGNLHYLLGFWIALPLTLVSVTGIYLSFPQTARSTMSAIAPMNPQAGRPIFAAQLARETQLTPDAALDAARNARPGWRPSALFLATLQSERGERSERPEQRSERPDRSERQDRSERAAATWRVQLRDRSSNDVATVMVNDRDGTARSLRVNFNEEEILGKTGTCSHAGTRFGWFASYANTSVGRVVVVVFLQGGRPTFGPKAAEITGRIYRNMYDHNFFVSRPTAPADTATVKTETTTP